MRSVTKSCVSRRKKLIHHVGQVWFVQKVEIEQVLPVGQIAFRHGFARFLLVVGNGKTIVTELLVVVGYHNARGQWFGMTPHAAHVHVQTLAYFVARLVLVPEKHSVKIAFAVHFVKFRRRGVVFDWRKQVAALRIFAETVVLKQHLFATQNRRVACGEFFHNVFEPLQRVEHKTFVPRRNVRKRTVPRVVCNEISVVVSQKTQHVVLQKQLQTLLAVCADIHHVARVNYLFALLIFQKLQRLLQRLQIAVNVGNNAYFFHCAFSLQMSCATP